MAKNAPQWWNPLSWFGGGEEEEKPDTSAITSAARPFQSLSEIPMGSTLNDIIMKALKEGKGVGFSPEYAEKTTSPLVASRKASWKETELPFLQSSLAGRGISRSTLGARDVGRAEASKERDINEIMGQAYKENEAQKKIDQSKYETMGQSFMGQEAAQKGAYASDDLSRAMSVTGLNETERLRKLTQQQNDLNQIIGAAIKYVAPAALAPFTGGSSLAMYGATGITELMDKYKQLQEAEKAASTAKPFI